MRRMLLILVLVALCLHGNVYAIVVTPSNIQQPNALGGFFSFDLTVYSAGSLSQGFQSTMGVQGPGVLSLDVSQSKSVSGNPNYWLYGNSTGAEIKNNGDGTYSFGDGPIDAKLQSLTAGKIMARYAFKFDGPIGWHTFTIDFDTKKSFSMNENFGTDPIDWDKGNYPGTEASFNAYIVPEPASLLLLGLGGMMIAKSRAAKSV